MPDKFYELQVNRTLEPLNLVGEYRGDGGVDSLIISRVPDPKTPRTPEAPSLTSNWTRDSRTQVTLHWVPPDNTDRPPVTAYKLYRSQDGGAYAQVGSDISPTLDTIVDSSLPTNTPEYVFRYYIKAVNADGIGDQSNIIATQWNGIVIQAPTAPLTLIARSGSITETSVQLDWTETADASVTKKGLYRNNTLVLEIDAAATTYLWSGLTAGSTETDINIRRFNSEGWSPASPKISFTTKTPGISSFQPLMGCSDSDNNNGGTEDWDVWRSYRWNGTLTLGNRTGALHPKIIAVTSSASDTGSLWLNYNSGTTPTYGTWVDRLNEFYYQADGVTPHPTRFDVELHIGNGNEYGDKVTSSNLDAFIEGCRGIYQATRLTNTNGQRKFPLASSWLDPTHNQAHNSLTTGSAGSGSVALWDSIYPAVPYLDGIAWSMYPPGRTSVGDDPTLDWPGFDEKFMYDTSIPDLQKAQRGYLIRCFKITYDAQNPATNSNLTSFRKLKIATWEIGQGADGGTVSDQTTRPYFAVHAMVASMNKLSDDYSLEMPAIIWWDQLKDNDPVNPHNVLSDEPAPGPGQISTRVAWQNWRQYSHWHGGEHPADWPTTPRTTWKNRNTTWMQEWVTDMNNHFN